MALGSSNYDSRPMLNRITSTDVARRLAESMYFGTEKAAIRAYAPKVIE